MNKKNKAVIFSSRMIKWGMILVISVCFFNQVQSFTIVPALCESWRTHQAITERGLANIQGLSSAEISHIASHSKDPDDPLDHAGPCYHFLISDCSWWPELQWVYRTLLDNAKVNTVDDDDESVFENLGRLMHFTEDFYSHTNWVDYHDACVHFNFDGAYPPDETLWQRSPGLDCDYTLAGNRALSCAVQEAPIQFQKYLKEMFLDYQDDAEALVNNVFPDVKDLAPIGMLTVNYLHWSKSIYLHWNNFSNESIIIQILKDGSLLGNIATVSSSALEYLWCLNDKLTNGVSLAPGTGYQLRLKRENGTKTFDSPCVFEICGTRILTPAANAQWNQGALKKITIQSRYPEDSDELGTWNVNLWKENEMLGTIGTFNISAGANTYDLDWIVGTHNAGQADVGSGYWIQIVHSIRTYLVYQGESFSIINPTLSVISPNGGEIWTVGSSHNITWNLIGTIANVKIEYSTNSGSTWSDIIASTPNDGIYSWTIPNISSTTCRVRVSDAADGNPSDASDANFTVKAATPLPSLIVNGGFESGWTGWPGQDGVCALTIPAYQGAKACKLTGFSWGSNLIANGGFESNWTAWPTKTGNYSLSTVRRSGSYSCKLTGQAAAESGLGSNAYAVQGGKAYDLTSYVKYLSGSGYYKVTIAWLNNSGGVIRYDNDWKGTNKPASFTFHGGTFTAPATAVTAKIMLGVSAGTAFLFDDIALELYETFESSVFSAVYPAQAGTAYKLNSYVKYRSGPGNYKVTIAWLNSSNGVIAYANDWKGTNRPSSYTWHGGTFTAPANTAKVRVILGVAIKSSYLFDGIELIPQG